MKHYLIKLSLDYYLFASTNIYKENMLIYLPIGNYQKGDFLTIIGECEGAVATKTYKIVRAQNTVSCKAFNLVICEKYEEPINSKVEIYL